MTSEAKLERRRVYVCGHRNPDTDSIASAIGYAELKNHLDADHDYKPVRLGVANAQTSWLIERAGAPLPIFLPHAKLRVRDVMRKRFAVANRRDPVRTVGLLMAPKDVVPIVDDDGVLRGVLTERALARRYIRESREASRLDAPTPVGSIVSVLEGELICGSPEDDVRGRVWVQAMDSAAESNVERGDVVVVGDRHNSQKRAIATGVSLLVLSNGVRPSEEIVALARDAGTAIVSSPLDSYVTSRMITLSEPVHAFVEGDPLTVALDDLVSDISEQIKTVHYRAAVALDRGGRPIGLVTRSDLVNPAPRRVLLVDHAERAQSVHGIEEAEIVEILDHHHIGSIETRNPVTAIFDPVGSTATLVTERFRQAGLEPTKPTATMLLGAICSDTVLLDVADDDRARSHRHELARDAAVGRRDRVRPRDVRGQLRRLAGVRGGSRRARPQGVRARRQPVAERRPDRDGRRRAGGPHRGAARRGPRAPRAPRPAAVRADGHRHPRPVDDAARSPAPSSSPSARSASRSSTARSTCRAS